jgi:hypothetical protein
MISKPPINEVQKKHLCERNGKTWRSLNTIIEQNILIFVSIAHLSTKA